MASKYADLLRDKGFRQMPAIRVDGVPQVHKLSTPIYMMMSFLDDEGMTQVVDELGQVWMAKGLHSFEGVDNFQDATVTARAVAELLGWGPKTN